MIGVASQRLLVSTSTPSIVGPTLFTVTVKVLTAEIPPSLSCTRTGTVNVPGRVKAYVASHRPVAGFSTANVSKLPLPSKSYSYVRTSSTPGSNASTTLVSNAP